MERRKDRRKERRKERKKERRHTHKHTDTQTQTNLFLNMYKWQNIPSADSWFSLYVFERHTDTYTHLLTHTEIYTHKHIHTDRQTNLFLNMYKWQHIPSGHSLFSLYVFE